MLIKIKFTKLFCEKQTKTISKTQLQILKILKNTLKNNPFIDKSH